MRLRAAEDVGPYRLFDFPFVRDDESNRSRSACGNATCEIDPDLDSSKAPYLTQIMNPVGARLTPSDTGFSFTFSSDQTNVAFAPG